MHALRDAHRARAFGGEDVTETLASVVKTDPAWDALPTNLSPSLRAFLRQCLQKNEKQRLHDIADMRLALEGAFETAAMRPEQSVPVPQQKWQRALPIAGTATLAILATGFLAWSLWPATAPPLISRFDVSLPQGLQFRNTGRPVMALSPDGQRFVYNATGGLYLRTMGELSAQRIPGTEASLTNPIFSPDGQSVACYESNALKRISLSGGAPVVICAATNPFGMSWERQNTILFGQREDIMRVSADGGTPELVIRAASGEQIYGPQMLPDGESVLFSVTRATGDRQWDEAHIGVQSLRTGQRTVVLKGGSDARYVPTGHLVYALENRLLAVAFDVKNLQVQGAPASVTAGVMRAGAPSLTTATANYGISDQGTLVYATGGASAEIQRTLVWVDRAGQEEVIPAPIRAYVYPRVSPDGTRVALDIRDQENDIWIWHLGPQTLTRLTFDRAADSYPVWSPDSRRLIFSSTRSGEGDIYWQAVDGTGAPERLTDGPNQQYPHTISPDGVDIVFREVEPGVQNDAVPGGQNDLMRLLIDPQPRSPSPAVARTHPLVQTRFNELNAEISPDGRWLAYQSDESGRYEIYVRPFPAVGSGRWQLSTSGGRTPVWARSGGELFYLAPDGTIQGVRVDRSPSWRASAPTRTVAGHTLLPTCSRGWSGRSGLRCHSRRQAFPDDKTGQRHR